MTGIVNALRIMTALVSLLATAATTILLWRLDLAPMALHAALIGIFYAVVTLERVFRGVSR